MLASLSNAWLVVVDDQAELDLLAELFGDAATNAMIGLNRKLDPPDQFEWMSGEVNDFSAWCGDQPDDFEGMEDAVQLWFPDGPSACWNDVDPMTPAPAIWEFRLPTGPDEIGAGGRFARPSLMSGRVDHMVFRTDVAVRARFQTADDGEGCPVGDDTVLELRVGGQRLAWNDDIEPGQLCSSVTLNLPPGAYDLTVRGFNGDLPVEYTVVVTMEPFFTVPRLDAQTLALDLNDGPYTLTAPALDRCAYVDPATGGFAAGPTCPAGVGWTPVLLSGTGDGQQVVLVWNLDPANLLNSQCLAMVDDGRPPADLDDAPVAMFPCVQAIGGAPQFLWHLAAAGGGALFLANALGDDRLCLHSQSGGMFVARCDQYYPGSYIRLARPD